MELLFDVLDEGGRVNIGEIVGSLLGRGIDFQRQIDIFILQDLQKVFVNGDRLDPFEFQNSGEFVDEGVEGIAGRQNQHVAGFDLLVVIHEITEAMQHHHRLAAARAALEHETFSLGTGDDFVLFFLDRFDDILDRGLFLAVFDDLPKIVSSSRPPISSGAR